MSTLQKTTPYRDTLCGTTLDWNARPLVNESCSPESWNKIELLLHGEGRNASVYTPLVSPVASNRVWLVGRHQAAGLGHSIASFLTLVRLAKEHNLTLHATFTLQGSGSHSYRNLNVDAFLGFSSFFSEPCRAPPGTATSRHFKNIVDFQEQAGACLRDISGRDPAVAGHVLKILVPAPSQNMEDLPFPRALILAMNGIRRLVGTLAGLPFPPSRFVIANLLADRSISPFRGFPPAADKIRICVSRV